MIPSDARGDDQASVTSGMDEVGVGEGLNNNFIAEGRGGSRRSQRTAEELEIMTPGEDIADAGCRSICTCAHLMVDACIQRT